MSCYIQALASNFVSLPTSTPPSFPHKHTHNRAILRQTCLLFACFCFFSFFVGCTNTLFIFALALYVAPIFSNSCPIVAQRRFNSSYWRLWAAGQPPSLSPKNIKIRKEKRKKKKEIITMAIITNTTSEKIVWKIFLPCT